MDGGWVWESRTQPEYAQVQGDETPKRGQMRVFEREKTQTRPVPRPQHRQTGLCGASTRFEQRSANPLSSTDLGADRRPELTAGGNQFFCSFCRTMLSVRIAAPAPAKEPTADPIAAAATGSVVGRAVQSSAGQSGRSPEVPADLGVSAGGGVAGAWEPAGLVWWGLRAPPPSGAGPKH